MLLFRQLIASFGYTRRGCSLRMLVGQEERRKIDREEEEEEEEVLIAQLNPTE